MLSLSLLLDTIAVAIVSMLILILGYSTLTLYLDILTTVGLVFAFTIFTALIIACMTCFQSLLTMLEYFDHVKVCKRHRYYVKTKSGKFSRTRIGWKGRKSSSKLAKLKLASFFPTKQPIKHSIYSHSRSAFCILFYIILLLAFIPGCNAKSPNNAGGRLPIDPPRNPHMDSPFPFRQSYART